MNKVLIEQGSFDLIKLFYKVSREARKKKRTPYLQSMKCYIGGQENRW